MRFSIITPNYNGDTFLEQTLKSVISQRGDGIEIEYIVIDGGSTDRSPDILSTYQDEITHLLIEPDTGPANAINKGFALATGDVISWLNADDYYFPMTLQRIKKCLEKSPEVALCFGSCPIVDADSQEIRHGITRFKEAFFPISSRFTHQCINYISQPTLFFRKSSLHKAGPLREDLVAAWDYDFILRLWRQGKGHCIAGEPLAAFRWHEQSISGQNFQIQFKEEYEAIRNDIGLFMPQTLIHYCVRWAIVTAYWAMSCRRSLRASRET